VRAASEHDAGDLGSGLGRGDVLVRVLAVLSDPIYPFMCFSHLHRCEVGHAGAAAAACAWPGWSSPRSLFQMLLS